MTDRNDDYDPFDQMTFSNDRCFLCGAYLDEKNRTVEHIFPKWLQKKFNLWDKELVLLNGSSLKYRQAIIPCCRDCNNKLSAVIEKPMKDAMKLGFYGMKEIDHKIIFQWINKISYGTLFRELSLKHDKKDPNSRNIFSEEFLREYSMQFMFLKSTIRNTTFLNNPWSILLFKIRPGEYEKYWAFDELITKSFFIRMNDVGIIANLMDNGCQQGFFIEHESDLLNEELHPIQFAELCAMVLYKNNLLKPNPSYFVLSDKNDGPGMIVSNRTSGEIYGDWSQQTYARFLAYFLSDWGFSYEQLYRGDGCVLSFLKNEDGTFKTITEF